MPAGEKTVQSVMAIIDITMEASWSYKQPALASSRGKRACAKDNSLSTGLRTERTGEEVHPAPGEQSALRTQARAVSPDPSSLCAFFSRTHLAVARKPPSSRLVCAFSQTGRRNLTCQCVLNQFPYTMSGLGGQLTLMGHMIISGAMIEAPWAAFLGCEAINDVTEKE